MPQVEFVDLVSADLPKARVVKPAPTQLPDLVLEFLFVSLHSHVGPSWKHSRAIRWEWYPCLGSHLLGDSLKFLGTGFWNPDLHEAQAAFALGFVMPSNPLCSI